MLTVQQDEVMVPVIPGPAEAPRRAVERGRAVKPGRRSTGVFLDCVIWFSIFAAASGFSLLASAIFDDIRTLAGF
jgi:hypothetical protein